MTHPIDFYSSPSSYTEVREFRPLLQALPDDLESILRFVKTLLIHPLAARACGVRFNFKSALRSQVDHRSVSDIISNPKVRALLERGMLNLDSNPTERGILSCDHHEVLLVAILRLKVSASVVKGFWPILCESYTHRV